MLDDEAKPIKDPERKFTNENLRNRGKNLTAEKLEVRVMDKLVAATAGWEFRTGDDGEPCTFHGEVPEFSAANVRRLYRELPWVKDQVAEALADSSAFFRGTD